MITSIIVIFYPDNGITVFLRAAGSIKFDTKIYRRTSLSSDGIGGSSCFVT
ncbi:hypothetical protein [Bacteroides uniformis]|uniref:hypothetical protein n=1 Tax=Bacteroides uniformis TaxID=820 RepID=UPI0035679AB6